MANQTGIERESDGIPHHGGIKVTPNTQPYLQAYVAYLKAAATARRAAMSEPTLEQIADGRDDRGCQWTIVVLARELIALRDRVQTLDELNDRGESWERAAELRLDALERGAVGDGDLSVVGVDGYDLLLSDGTSRPTQAAYARIETLTAQRDSARAALREIRNRSIDPSALTIATAALNTANDGSTDG